jgi:hypothetical protein
MEKQLASLKEEANKLLAAYNQAVGAIGVLEHLLSQPPIVDKSELTEDDLKTMFGATDVQVIPVGSTESVADGDAGSGTTA